MHPIKMNERVNLFLCTIFPPNRSSSIHSSNQVFSIQNIAVLFHSTGPLVSTRHFQQQIIKLTQRRKGSNPYGAAATPYALPDTDRQTMTLFARRPFPMMRGGGDGLRNIKINLNPTISIWKRLGIFFPLLK